MPAKKKCQASIVITAPPLPAATQTVTSPGPSNTTPLTTSDAAAAASSTDEPPRSPGGSVLTKQLPATLASSSTLRCPHPAVRIVGDCSFCGKSFCGNHRLPEHHGCTGLQACRDAAHAANKAKLEAEKTQARKVAST